MLSLAIIVGNLALIFTIINFGSGVQICRKIYLQGTTSDVSPLPFLTGILCTFIWLEYGVWKPDNIVAFVNVVGLLLQVSFLVCFYKYTKIKQSLHLKTAILLAVLMLVHCNVTYFVESNDAAVRILGFIGAGASLTFFASPLASLAHVVKTKSVESLPFPLILSSFIVSTLWSLYGILCDDPFIYSPNTVASIITVCQLGLFLIYPSKAVRSCLAEEPLLHA
ncbi:sugar transporter SWEET1-like [Ornithodoros turicata]|uniref:sugar transporter SWEET1-like n=1 Tax=Ornithodoros turicata TaxID=34597 RepID=UPI0031397A18